MKRTIRAIAFAVVLLLAVLAQPARADYPCIADTPLTRLAGPAEIIGSVPVEVSTAAGEATGWWCLDPVTATTPPGKVTFSRWYQYSLVEHRGHPDLRGAMKRVLAAPNLLAAVNGEMRAGSIAVPADSQKEYEIKVLLRNACIALSTPPYSVPIDPLPAGVCGPAPVPPGPQAERWVVTPSGTAATRQAFALVAGKRQSASTAQATVRAPCDCTATKLTEFGAVYCRVPPESLIPTTAVPHVAGCVLQR